MSKCLEIRPGRDLADGMSNHFKAIMSNILMYIFIDFTRLIVFKNRIAIHNAYFHFL